jgi:hypothetical protein
MTRLMSVPILLCCVSLFWAGSGLASEDFCSLIVKPVSAESRDLSAIVTVVERDGTKLEKASGVGGARFCNLGFSPVTITVRNNCSTVVLDKVQVNIVATRTLPVITYDCLPLTVIVGCRVLFRFVDSRANPIVGVLVNLRSPFEKPYLADQFGRLLVGTEKEDLTGTATAKGYEPVELNVPCRERESRNVEQFVTMKDVK